MLFNNKNGNSLVVILQYINEIETMNSGHFRRYCGIWFFHIPVMFKISSLRRYFVSFKNWPKALPASGSFVGFVRKSKALIREYANFICMKCREIRLAALKEINKAGASFIQLL